MQNRENDSLGFEIRKIDGKALRRRFKKGAAVVLAMFVACGTLPYGVGTVYGAAEHRVYTSADFKTALNDVSNGGTIYLMNDIDGVSSSTVSSSKTFTIEGNGHTIKQTSNGSAPIRTSGSSTHVTVRNVNFDGGGYTGTFKYGGGAIAAYKGNVTVENCTFMNLRAADGSSTKGGGAIMVQSGKLYVRNSTFYNNTTSKDGGAIYAGSSGTITNCTIIGNSASGKGGGVRNNSSSTSSQTQIYNTIIIGNTDTDSGGDVYRGVDAGYNIFGTSTYGMTAVNTSQYNIKNSGWIENEPKDNGGMTLTMALIPTEDSPAINKGGTGTNSNVVTDTDQRGYARLEAPDIGAYEYRMISTELDLLIGQVYDFSNIENAAGLFETVECSDGFEGIIEFDPDSNEKIKAIGPGEAVVSGYVGGSKYIEVSITVSEESIEDKVTSFDISNMPEEVDSEVWFDVEYDIETEGNASKDVEIIVTQADGTELPDHVLLMPIEEKEDGKTGVMLVNEPVDESYTDVELLIKVKPAADFTMAKTKTFTLKKPKETAVTTVRVTSSAQEAKSEESIVIKYEVSSPGGTVANAQLQWSYAVSKGVVIRGLDQGQITDSQSGSMTIEVRNDSSTMGTLEVSAVSVDNPYRSDQVEVGITGVEKNVYSYDELYRAVVGASDGDIISIRADLNAKKVTLADGTSSASINSASRSLQSTITIKKDITIEGNGHTIDGQGYYAIFYGTEGTLSLKNLTITNAVNTNTSSSEKQGVAVCLKGGDLYMENVTIYGCESAVGNGGAVYAGDGSEIYIKNCTLVNNKGRYGGGIYVDKAEAKIENTIIFNNRADKNGDNLSFSSSASIEDAGYNIIYDVFNYSNSSTTFDYHENTVSKENLDVYPYEWISGNLGSNGGNAKTVSLIKSDNSPAIDKIPQNNCPDKDQRGITRTGMGDIGAHEYYGIEGDYTLDVNEKILIDDDFRGNRDAFTVLDAVKTWETSSRAAATVEGGYITAHRDGSTVIKGRDGSGSVVVDLNVYVGKQSIASVEIETEKGELESGEAFAVTYAVNGSDGADKTLRWSAQLYDAATWDKYDDLPEGANLVGLPEATSLSTGTINLNAVNRTEKDIVIALRAVSVTDNSKEKEILIAVKHEQDKGMDVTVNAVNRDGDSVNIDGPLQSGSLVSIDYALLASPSVDDKTVVWKVDGDDDITLLGLPDQTDGLTHEFSFTVINTGSDDGEITLTAERNGEISETVTFQAAPLELDGVSGATIVNRQALKKSDAFEHKEEITVFYGISNDPDFYENFRWNVYQCDPKDHDDIWELADNVEVWAGETSGKLEKLTSENSGFETSRPFGILVLKVSNTGAGQEMIVLEGISQQNDVFVLDMAEASVLIEDTNGEEKTDNDIEDKTGDEIKGGGENDDALADDSNSEGETTDKDNDEREAAADDNHESKETDSNDDASVPADSDLADTAVLGALSEPAVNIGYHFLINAVMPTSIKISAETTSLQVGDTAALTAEILPKEADQSVVWSTSDGNIASVSQQGLISGISEGIAVITASTPDGSLSASCTVTVQKKDEGNGNGNGSGNGSGGGSGGGSTGSKVKEDKDSDTSADENSDTEKTGNETPQINVKDFRDISEKDWYYEPVNYVISNGLFAGTGDGEFSPGTDMSRAMFVTVLGRMAESLDIPTDGYDAGFADVDRDSWYGGYAAWASVNGIASGYSETEFGAGDSITREQMAVMLVRFVEHAELILEEELAVTYADGGQVSSWAEEAVSKASAWGLITGYEDGTFGPKKTATRAEVAVVFMNFANACGEQN